MGKQFFCLYATEIVQCCLHEYNLSLKVVCSAFQGINSSVKISCQILCNYFFFFHAPTLAKDLDVQISI